MRAALATLLLLAACMQPAPQYRHSRYDYWAFRARVGMLPEPNYLPWVMHRELLPRSGSGGGEALVACRWADTAFPLRYFVEPPAIPSETQDEFHPRDPGEYVVAVVRAFELWEEAIGRPVRFIAVDSAEEAVLVVRLSGEMHSAADKLVLGRVREIRDQCRVVGPGLAPETVEISFGVPEAELFIVDPHGLLTPRQVQTVALHEIGHILGAGSQHSPLAGDVMYKIADDTRTERLSEHDRNTFRALYRLPPGSVYARTTEIHSEPLSEIRRGPPRLDKLHSDERQGFGVRFPVGWQVIRSRVGFVAVDGVTWDYDASIQIMALRGELEAFVQQQRRSLALRGELEATERLELDGQPVARIVARGDGWTEQTAVQEWADGWLLVLVADCATRDYPLYRPWFERVMLSIDRM
jgi:hypothetical protein